MSSFGTSSLSPIAMRVEKEESDEESETEEEGVQLGFAEEVSPSERLLFDRPAWNDWDGGIAGGHPVWQDPTYAFNTVGSTHRLRRRLGVTSARSSDGSSRKSTRHATSRTPSTVRLLFVKIDSK